MNPSQAKRIATAYLVMGHSLTLQYLVRAIRDGRKDEAMAEIRKQRQAEPTR